MLIWVTKLVCSDPNTVPAGFSDQFSSTRLRSLNPIKVAKPKVLFKYWSSKNPKFLVAKPKMVAKPKVAKPSGHFIFYLFVFDAPDLASVQVPEVPFRGRHA